MHLQYNGVDLQIERTADFDMKPVRDASGMDMLYQEVIIGMNCVFNPYATTSNPPAVATNPRINSIPNTNGVGDTLGRSIAHYANNNLRQLLMTDRQQLYIWIGNDLVFAAPEPETNIFVGGAAHQGPSACDPGGGPFPEDLKLIQIIGDKSALVYFRIRFYVTDCQRFVLSNRWRMISQMDEQFVTTRIIEGRATFRLDYLQDQKITPDQFRSQLIIPTPDGFTRKRVDVIATEDGREVHYVAVDHQAQRNLGYGWAVRVEGNATAGVEWPLASVRSALILGSQVSEDNVAGFIEGAGVSSLFGRIGKAMGRAMGGTELGKKIIANALAAICTAKANIIVKVFGTHVNDQTDAQGNDPNRNGLMPLLAQLAVNIANDRMAPIFTMKILGKNFNPILSAYLTQDFGSDNGPYVELRMELLPANQALLTAVMNPIKTSTPMMNLSTGYSTLGNTGMIKPQPNQPPLFSGGTRGDYVSYLVTQALLTTGCELVPNVPPPNTYPNTTDTLPVADEGDLAIS